MGVNSLHYAQISTHINNIFICIHHNLHYLSMGHHAFLVIITYYFIENLCQDVMIKCFPKEKLQCMYSLSNIDACFILNNMSLVTIERQSTKSQINKNILIKCIRFRRRKQC